MFYKCFIYLFFLRLQRLSLHLLTLLVIMVTAVRSAKEFLPSQTSASTAPSWLRCLWTFRLHKPKLLILIYMFLIVIISAWKINIYFWNNLLELKYLASLYVTLAKFNSLISTASEVGKRAEPIALVLDITKIHCTSLLPSVSFISVLEGRCYSPQYNVT